MLGSVGESSFHSFFLSRYLNSFSTASSMSMDRLGSNSRPKAFTLGPPDPSSIRRNLSKNNRDPIKIASDAKGSFWHHQHSV